MQLTRRNFLKLSSLFAIGTTLKVEPIENIISGEITEKDGYYYMPREYSAGVELSEKRAEDYAKWHLSFALYRTLKQKCFIYGDTIYWRVFPIIDKRFDFEGNKEIVSIYTRFLIKRKKYNFINRLINIKWMDKPLNTEKEWTPERVKKRIDTEYKTEDINSQWEDFYSINKIPEIPKF